MHTRRSVLAVAGATVLAGCSSSGSQSASQQSETTNETQSQADNPDLTAGEIHDNSLDAEFRMSAVEAATASYVEGRQDGDLYTGLYKAVDTLSDELTYLNGDPEEYHEAIVGGLNEITSDTFQVYSTFEEGKSAKYTDTEWETSRIWLEQDAEEDGDTIDILTALSPDAEAATHLKGTDPENPSTGQKELQRSRDPENFGTHGPHDIEAMRKVTEYNEEEREIEYSDEDIEEANSSWLERFDAMFWSDGMAVPAEGNWEEYHDNFHSVHPEVNEQMYNSDEIGEGDVAAFTVNNGEVTLYSTVDGYNPEQDGMPTEEEIKQI